MKSEQEFLDVIFMPIEQNDHRVHWIRMNGRDWRKLASIARDPKRMDPVKQKAVLDTGVVAHYCGATISLNESLSDGHFEVEDEIMGKSWVCTVPSCKCGECATRSVLQS